MKHIFGKCFVVAAGLALAGCPGFTSPGEAPFVPVSAIIDVPETALAGQDLALTGTVVPAGATNRAIAWSVTDVGTTGAAISGGTLTTMAPGDVVLTARIAGGLAVSVDYEDNFTITVQQSLPGAVALAKAVSTGVSVSEDGSDIVSDSYWTTQANWDAFNAAIAAAEALGPAASQADINNAIAALTAATEDFNAAKQLGSKTASDKTALNEALTGASAAKNGVVASADGSDISPDTYWATPDAFAALNAAIAAAGTTAQNAAADQASVDDAATALTAAIATFAAEKHHGTKAGSDSAPDKRALNEALTGASAAKNGVAASADGSDISPGAYWATPDAFAALDAAIAAAEATAQNAAADQASVDAAATALTTATADFAAEKHNGTKAPADKTALAAAIGAAQVAKAGVAESSVNGSDVSMVLYWVTPAVLAALDAAIEAAETTAQDSAANQAGVDAAKTALTAAINAFKGAARKGSKPVKTVSVGGVSFDMRYVDPPSSGWFKYDKAITYRAAISKGYWMGKTEVTQDLFRTVMGANPSYFASFTPAAGETQGARPVEWVSWYAAITFCNKLSILDGRTPAYSVKIGEVEVDWATLAYEKIPPEVMEGNWSNALIREGANGYRLPVEMEWMWAAMGGNEGGATVTEDGYTKPFAGSSGANSIDDYAWSHGNADGKTHEVGKKLPNELGLYDMTGNVSEWCWELLQGRTELDRHATPMPARVYRGGGWHSSSAYYTLGYRGEAAHDTPVSRFHYLGFRLALDQ
jgi:formylglycine-generating enzyme required for sulfatase activity